MIAALLPALVPILGKALGAVRAHAKDATGQAQQSGLRGRPRWHRGAGGIRPVAGPVGRGRRAAGALCHVQVGC
jgi:hypothetical protein